MFNRCSLLASLLPLDAELMHSVALKLLMPQKREDLTERRSPVLVTFAAGGLAGAVSRTLTAPLDRVKVLIQEGRGLDGSGCRSRLRVGQVVRQVYAEGGIASFWRGNGVNCLKAGPEFALVFSIRQLLMAKIQCNAQLTITERAETAPSGRCNIWCAAASLPIWGVNLLCGAVAGATAQTVLYPMEIVKTRLAVGTRNEYKGVADCVRQSYVRGGFREFYRGLVPNLVGIFPYRGLEVGLFFTLQHRILCARGGGDMVPRRPMEPRGATLSMIEVGALGTVSSVIAQTATYPLNLVRTKLQTQGVNGRPLLYDGMVHCLLSVVRSHGIVGLFHGITANYLKAVPATAATFIVFDRVQRALIPEA